MLSVIRLVVVAIAAALLVWAMGSAHAQDAEIGVIRSSDGEALIIRSGVTVPALVGDSVMGNDVLQTGADGSLGIILADSTQISLGPQSQFHLEDFEFEPIRQGYSIVGRMIQGTMVFISGDIGRLAPENIRIEIPWGAIGLRGTRFAVSVDAP